MRAFCKSGGSQPIFEFGATFDEHIGRAQLHDETRTRIDKVRIFRRLRQHGDVDLVAANLARERTEIGKRGDNVEFASAETRAKRKVNNCFIIDKCACTRLSFRAERGIFEVAFFMSI